MAGVLGFVPLSLPLLLVIFGIIAAYLIAAELTKALVLPLGAQQRLS